MLLNMNAAETFSIRQLVELTGLSEFTVRGWENRYSAFTPRRNETGRREYTKGDIERAILLRELLKRGHRIGGVAKLSDQKLRTLFERTDEARRKESSSPASPLAEQALELVALQKWSELEELMKGAPGKNAASLIRDFFLPALQALSASVDAGLLSISQEHVFSSFFKEKIYSVLSELDQRKSARAADQRVRFVLAAPEGDYHETGLLLAHLLIRSYGFTSLYLGPHTPARDLSETALRFEASHLLIVSTVSKRSGARQEPLTFVSEVQKKVGSHLKILLAGAQASLAHDPSPTLSVLGDFGALEGLLKNLEAQDA